MAIIVKLVGRELGAFSEYELTLPGDRRKVAAAIIIKSLEGRVPGVMKGSLTPGGEFTIERRRPLKPIKCKVIVKKTGQLLKWPK